MCDTVDLVRRRQSAMLNLVLRGPILPRQKELDQALMIAVQDGYEDGIEQLVGAGADCNVTDSAGYTVLKMACDKERFGHAGHVAGVNAVLHLLKGNCDVNIHNGGLGTALHIVARTGRDNLVTELIAKGAQVNSRDGTAAKNPHVALRVMQVLLKAGASVNIANNEGKTALHYAAHKAVGTELLLKAGADPDIQDINGNAPIHLGASEGFDKVVKTLCRFKCNPDLQNFGGKTATHLLGMKNHAEGIEAIVDIGGDVNIKDKQDKSPLWYAVNHNRPDAVKALLRANCQTHSRPTNHCDVTDDTRPDLPLQAALEKRLLGIAKLLVLAGCDVTPLRHWLQSEDLREESAQRAREQEMRLLYPAERPHTNLTFGDRDNNDVRNDNDEEINWLRNWLKNPPSLRQVCRVYIRRNLGASLPKQEKNIPLPTPLRDYITLRELEDHQLKGYCGRFQQYGI